MGYKRLEDTLHIRRAINSDIIAAPRSRMSWHVKLKKKIKIKNKWKLGPQSPNLKMAGRSLPRPYRKIVLSKKEYSVFSRNFFLKNLFYFKKSSKDL